VSHWKKRFSHHRLLVMIIINIYLYILSIWLSYIRPSKCNDALTIHVNFVFFFFEIFLSNDSWKDILIKSEGNIKQLLLFIRNLVGEKAFFLNILKILWLHMIFGSLQLYGARSTRAYIYIYLSWSFVSSFWFFSYFFNIYMHVRSGFSFLQKNWLYCFRGFNPESTSLFHLRSFFLCTLSTSGYRAEIVK